METGSRMDMLGHRIRAYACVFVYPWNIDDVQSTGKRLFGCRSYGSSSATVVQLVLLKNDISLSLYSAGLSDIINK